MLKNLNNIKQGKTIIIVTGPTASGKSDYAIRLAQKIQRDYSYRASILNADITQCYKGIEQLSASPSLQDKELIPHKLYNFLDIKVNFSVGDWLKETQKAINNCLKENIIPIVVGGTVLYIDCLVNGISPILEVPKDIKQESINLFNKVGRDKFILILQKLIQDFNKEEAEEDFPLDSQRLIRNHSLLIHTGKPLQYYKKLPRETHYPSEHFIKIAILPDRGKSYQKINERFVQNVDCYVNEVKNTMKDVDEMHNIYKAHGFREIKDYILGNITKEQMIDMATMQVRRYNKRQRTWINNKFKDFQIVNESSQDVLI